MCVRSLVSVWWPGWEPPGLLVSSFLPRSKYWGDTVEGRRDGKGIALQRGRSQDLSDTAGSCGGPSPPWRLSPRLSLTGRAPAVASTKLGSLGSQVCPFHAGPQRGKLVEPQLLVAELQGRPPDLEGVRGLLGKGELTSHRGESGRKVDLYSFPLTPR